MQFYFLYLYHMRFLVCIIHCFLIPWSIAIFTNTPDNWRIAVRLYRGSLLIILFLFLIGINVYGWRTSGVNHVLIFELDPRNHLSEQHLMEVSLYFIFLEIISIFYII